MCCSYTLHGMADMDESFFLINIHALQSTALPQTYACKGSQRYAIGNQRVIFSNNTLQPKPCRIGNKQAFAIGFGQADCLIIIVYPILLLCEFQNGPEQYNLIAQSQC